MKIVVTFEKTADKGCWLVKNTAEMPEGQSTGTRGWVDIVKNSRSVRSVVETLGPGKEITIPGWKDYRVEPQNILDSVKLEEKKNSGNRKR